MLAILWLDLPGRFQVPTLPKVIRAICKSVFWLGCLRHQVPM
jgi:hypothetical protein